MSWYAQTELEQTDFSGDTPESNPTLMSHGGSHCLEVRERQIVYPAKTTLDGEADPRTERSKIAPARSRSIWPIPHHRPARDGRSRRAQVRSRLAPPPGPPSSPTQQRGKTPSGMAAAPPRRSTRPSEGVTIACCTTRRPAAPRHTRRRRRSSAGEGPRKSPPRRIARAHHLEKPQRESNKIPPPPATSGL
jgi:hypothetical protein